MLAIQVFHLLKHFDILYHWTLHTYVHVDIIDIQEIYMAVSDHTILVSTVYILCKLVPIMPGGHNRHPA